MEQAPNQRTDSFASLPDDLVLDILRRIPGPSLFRYKLVCRYWKHLINKPDINDKHPMDLSRVPKRIFDWDVSALYEKQYNKKPSNSPSEYFHTSKQFKLFRGGLDKRPMYGEHRCVNWEQLEKFPLMASVVTAFGAMGLKDMMGMKQDWNDLVIRQFYATLEIRAEEEKLIWMTGTSILEASFSDLARACRLDYQAMKRGAIIVDLPYLSVKEEDSLYCDTTENGDGGILSTIPNVIWQLARRTFMADHENDTEYDNVLPCTADGTIMAVLKHKRLNIIDWLVNQMVDIRVDPNKPLIFQPYIMALVLLKLPGFKGRLDRTHHSYSVFISHKLQIWQRNPSSETYVSSDEEGSL